MNIKDTLDTNEAAADLEEAAREQEQRNALDAARRLRGEYNIRVDKSRVRPTPHFFMHWRKKP